MCLLSNVVLITKEECLPTLDILRCHKEIDSTQILTRLIQKRKSNTNDTPKRGTLQKPKIKHDKQLLNID